MGKPATYVEVEVYYRDGTENAADMKFKRNLSYKDIAEGIKDMMVSMEAPTKGTDFMAIAKKIKQNDEKWITIIINDRKSIVSNVKVRLLDDPEGTV